jgi:hypothetical protein
MKNKAVIDYIVDGVIRTIKGNSSFDATIDTPKCRKALREYLLHVIVTIVSNQAQKLKI